MKIDQREMLADLEPNRKRGKNRQRESVLQRLDRRRRDGSRPEVLNSDEGTFGYSALNIPELDYYVLMQRFPELNSKDSDIQKRAWQKFCRDPASLPYRVDDSIGKKQRADGIIIK